MSLTIPARPREAPKSSWGAAKATAATNQNYNAVEEDYNDLLQDKDDRAVSGLRLIQRDLIIVGDQPRRSFPPDEMKELSTNIRDMQERKEGIEGTGLITPLLVVRQGDKYLLVAGERRYRATKPYREWNGVELLPCIVVKGTAQSVRLMQLIENLQRVGLPPLEEAEGIQSLMTIQNLSFRDVGKLLGKSKGYIENRVHLLKMAPEIQNMVALRKDTLSHAYEINRVKTEPLRKKLVRSVLNEAISVVELRRQIEAQEEPQKSAASNNSPAVAASGQSSSSPAAPTPTPFPASQGTGMRTTSTPYVMQPPQPQPQHDFIQDEMQPVRGRLAEMVKEVENLLVTPDYRSQMRFECALLEAEVKKLKRAIA